MNLINDIKEKITRATCKLSFDERLEVLIELANWLKDEIARERRFSTTCDAYKQMYFSAKDDKERKDKINAFRAGNLKP